MADLVNMKDVVEHLTNGSLCENLCIICLMPLDEYCENIFTKVCKDDREYCIADVLDILCQIRFSELDRYNVCSDCFVLASAAYKFYILTRRSEEILNFYTEELEKNLNTIELSDEFTSDLCISIPEYVPTIINFDYDLDGVATNAYSEGKISDILEMDNVSQENVCKKEIKEDDEDIIVMKYEDGIKTFYKLCEDGSLSCIGKDEIEVPATRKKNRHREPMPYKTCSQCPIRYRFIAKLKEHMKIDHNIDLYVCKICKATAEDEDEFNNHMKTHTNIHRCDICNAIFKRRVSIIRHLKKHENKKNVDVQVGTHICEVCGLVLISEEHLKEHCNQKHDKKYTCFYCGRMYKGELSFEKHIKKHEYHLKNSKEESPRGQQRGPAARRFDCSDCGRDFVDERALMWHTRLHTNERPYTCDVCGRGFVTVNRRNQHAVCAHTVPTRRCPLCPALFHLRSMVNTHLKKVHLRQHKRSSRSGKRRDVFWRTEAVPVQELSVAIQHHILELQAAAPLPVREVKQEMEPQEYAIHIDGTLIKM